MQTCSARGIYQIMLREELQELYEYNPNTGIFISKIYRGKYKAGDIITGTLTDGYINIYHKGRVYGLHRLAFLFMGEPLPEKPFVVDHINRIRWDNRWVNLRKVTNSENAKNSVSRGKSFAEITAVVTVNSLTHRISATQTRRYTI